MRILFSILLVSVLLDGCKDDGQPPEKQGVLRIKLSTSCNNKDCPKPSHVYISLKDTLGNAVLVKEKLTLDLNTSAEIVLSPNSYVMTEITVLDTLDNVIYFIPLEDSELGKYVGNPLPLAFSIKTDSTYTLNLDVLTINTETLGVMQKLTFDEGCADCTADRHGVANHAFEFTGSNWLDYEVLAFSNKIGSVSFWISVSDTTIYQPIFYYGYNFSTPVTDLYQFYFKSERISGFGGWFSSTSTKVNFSIQTWRHVVLRWDYDRQKASLLIDGQNALSTLAFYRRSTGNTTVKHIGKDYIRDNKNHFGKPTITRYGKFIFDDLITYDRYLNDEEIKRLFKK